MMTKRVTKSSALKGSVTNRNRYYLSPTPLLLCGGSGAGGAESTLASVERLAGALGVEVEVLIAARGPLLQGV